LITVGLVGIAVLINPLPNLGRAPSYELINQNSQPVSDLDLRSHIVVYNFIYTPARPSAQRSQGKCPDSRSPYG
jgi:hypothetical protein